MLFSPSVKRRALGSRLADDGKNMQICDIFVAVAVVIVVVVKHAFDMLARSFAVLELTAGSLKHWLNYRTKLDSTLQCNFVRFDIVRLFGRPC